MTTTRNGALLCALRDAGAAINAVQAVQGLLNASAAAKGHPLAILSSLRPLQPTHVPRNATGVPPAFNEYIDAIHTRPLRESSASATLVARVAHHLFDDRYFVDPFVPALAPVLPALADVLRDHLCIANIDEAPYLAGNSDSPVQVRLCAMQHAPGAYPVQCVLRIERLQRPELGMYTLVYAALAAVLPAVSIIGHDPSYPMCLPVANALAMDARGTPCYVSVMRAAGTNMHVLGTQRPHEQLVRVAAFVARICVSPAHQSTCPVVYAHGDEHLGNILCDERMGAVLIDYAQFVHGSDGFGVDGAIFPPDCTNEWRRVCGIPPGNHDAPPTCLRAAAARMPIGPLYVILALLPYARTLAMCHPQEGARAYSCLTQIYDRHAEPALRWIEQYVDERGDDCAGGPDNINQLLLQCVRVRKELRHTQDQPSVEAYMASLQAIRYTVVGAEALLRARCCPTWAIVAQYATTLASLARAIVF